MSILAKFAYATLISVASATWVSAQDIVDSKTFTEILNSEHPITYLGVDFGSAKFIGTMEDWQDENFLNTYTIEWNNFILKDVKEQHLISQTFRIKEKLIGYRGDITLIHNSNQSYTDNIRYQQEFSAFEENDLKAILDAYNLEGMNGIGLMVIVESLDAFADLGTMHFTLFKMDTKEIIYSERHSGKPFGHYMKRYWAESIHDVLFYMRSIQYKKWKKEYLK